MCNTTQKMTSNANPTSKCYRLHELHWHIRDRYVYFDFETLQEARQAYAEADATGNFKLLLIDYIHPISNEHILQAPTLDPLTTMIFHAIQYFSPPYSNIFFSVMDLYDKLISYYEYMYKIIKHILPDDLSFEVMLFIVPTEQNVVDAVDVLFKLRLIDQPYTCLYRSTTSRYWLGLNGVEPARIG